MAFRIHDSVVRGEIDNRVKGIVRGKIWVEGRAEPVVLELKGNAHPDLAGCLLTFTNPHKRIPHHGLDTLNPVQQGTIGDLTASRKVRVPAVPMEEFLNWPKDQGRPPTHWANCLYLEWFSEQNGRVVIESADYQLTISAPEWRLTPEEDEQRARQAAAGRDDFMRKLTEAIAEQQRGRKDPEAEWDEHDYEKLMKESDARTDKYLELLEKYGDSDEAEEKIAKEMGWLKELTPEEAEEESRRIEEMNRACEEALNEPPPEPDPHREGIDWIRTKNGSLGHPLQHRCSESAIKYWKLTDELGLEKTEDKDLGDFIFEFQTTGAKLAGALSGIARGEGFSDDAFTVACLKRALDHLHKSQAGLEAVAPKRRLPDKMIAEARKELFELREGILKLMDEFRAQPMSRMFKVIAWSLAGFVFSPSLAMAAPVETSPADAVRELNRWLARPRAERPQPGAFADVPLSRADAAAALNALWQDRVALVRSTRTAEMQSRVIELDGQEMKFAWSEFGGTNAIPPGGRSLFLSLHGGGNAPMSVNDSQWTNQLRLGAAYRPAEGIYVAPRAPTDDWNLWHQAPVDDFFARLIEDFVVFNQVNPNRVYLLGYSAGGDGVYQVAPRTPDRWAAASMMAGHPNEASPLGLRNVPFSIQVGADDASYHRNEVAAEWGRKLDALQQADPRGYVHFSELHAGKGHWMDLEDRKAIPWMEQFTRDPLPERAVWYQDDVTHTRCYWLARPKAEVKAGQELVAERDGQVITLASTNVGTVTVLLNDAMLDLDQPVVVRAGGEVLFSNLVSRTVACLAKTLEDRGDINLAFSAAVTVTLPAATEQAVQLAGTNGVELAKALQGVPASQRAAMRFLVANMPAPDRETLTADFLLTNTALACGALTDAPWSNQIPPDVFLNDILPYAVVNERRDDWRGRLRELCAPLVKDCRTSGEAALTLNRKLFDLVKVHYSTQREKADQSPLESMQSGRASCTGLSILLADACRSVGVPARIVGTPMWLDGRGNHTWVEIWDGGWHFIGAAEPDAAGLDHAWFTQAAAQARADEPPHALYASSFRPTGLAFPLDWAPEIHWVNAVNVTSRYAWKTAPAAGTVRLLVKVVDAKGKRVAAPVAIVDPADSHNTLQGRSRDESADRNNILSFDWPAGARGEISVENKGRELRQTVTAPQQGEQVVVIQLSD